MTRTFCLVAAAQLLATAVAQAPGEAPANRSGPEAKLHSLQLLLTETIFTRQPLAPTEASAPKPGAPGAAAPGSSGDRPFAVVRDAMFEPSGRLTSLVVEAPSTDAGAGRTAGARVLPARSVQWDEASKRWVVGEVSLQWAELAEYKPEAAPTKEPATTPSQRPVLASELLTASVTGLTAAEVGATEATLPKSNTKTRVVWWLTPLHQQLAFAVVTSGDKYLALPWALVRPSGSGAVTEVRVQVASTALEGAPTVASAMEQPSAAVRQAAYKHYAVEVPKWDRSSPTPMKDDKGAEPKGAGEPKAPPMPPMPPTERTPPPKDDR